MIPRTAVARVTPQRKQSRNIKLYNPSYSNGSVRGSILFSLRPLLSVLKAPTVGAVFSL
jgi:hypothetical protein